MAGDLYSRPRFYEGQYLSADDLAAIVEYLRGADARHALGAHTWGIAIGLHLTERNAPGAPERREVILQPGFAWDGFGRAIVVGRPTRLQEADIIGIPRIADLDDPAAPGGLKGRLIKVWLAYKESATRLPATGFETCATDDQNSRVAESFRFVFGGPPPIGDRARISVGGQNMDAADAIKHFDGSTTVIHDASIPHQAFPAGKPPQWLVPVGYVRWVALDDSSGYFAKLDLVPSEKAGLRVAAFRRYAGVVAEDIAASHHAVVIRRRDHDPKAQHRRGNLLARVSDPSQTPDPAWVDEVTNDLAWVEGNLRVLGEARINGGKLHFRNEDGDDKKTPLFLARHGDGQAADGNRELRVVIGDDARKDASGNPQRDNKLIVGPLEEAALSTEPPITPCLAVVSNGRAGVGTADPRARLEVAGGPDQWGTAAFVPHASKGVRVSHVHWDPTGDWYIRSAAGGGKVVLQDNGGNVGIGTNGPTQLFTLGGEGGTRLEIGRVGASFPWCTNAPANPGSFAINQQSAGSTNAAADLALKRDGKLRVVLGDVNTIVSGQDGDVRIAANFGEPGERETMRATAAGNVGIGTVSPRARLEVSGTADTWGTTAFVPDAAKGPHVSHVHWNPKGDWYIRSAAGDGKVIIQDSGGAVGVGTNAPQQKLHVQGNRIRLENAGKRVDLRADGSAVDLHSESHKLYIQSTAPGGQNHVVINPHAANGNVGVGTSSPAAKLDVTGNLHITGNAFKDSLGAWWLPSDAVLKRDIESIEDALGLILRLRGVSFTWREPEKHGATPGRYMGLVAQEVEKVFPEWVLTNPAGHKAVNLVGFEGLLIEAMRELNARCERLEAEVASLRARAGAGGARRPKKSRAARDRD